ncbi:hypothetical protein [Calidifontibacillus oryziterrae]|uniref:hypothetical protein n=1 Tax=Calidifontibacillus oryziterrae TaxID=1191699 RepID=UPI0002FC4529|nr:hypothetical protein [Calidifontibacillus oryziterrae]
MNCLKKIFIGGLFVFFLLTGCSIGNETTQKEINIINNNEVWIENVPNEIHIELVDEINLFKRIDNKKEIQDIIEIINTAMDLDNKGLKFFDEKNDEKPKYIGIIRGFDEEIELYQMDHKEVIYMVSAKGVKSIVANNFYVLEYIPEPIPPGKKPSLDEIVPIPPGGELENDDIKKLNP